MLVGQGQKAVRAGGSIDLLQEGPALGKAPGLGACAKIQRVVSFAKLFKSFNISPEGPHT